MNAKNFSQTMRHERYGLTYVLLMWTKKNIYYEKEVKNLHFHGDPFLFISINNNMFAQKHLENIETHIKCK